MTAPAHGPSTRRLAPLAIVTLALGCNLFGGGSDDDRNGAPAPPPPANPEPSPPRATGVYSRGYEVAWRRTIDMLNRACDTLDHYPLDTVDRVRAAEFVDDSGKSLRRMEQYVCAADKEKIGEFAAQAEYACAQINDTRGDSAQVLRGLQGLVRRVQEELAPGRVTVELATLGTPEPPPPPELDPIPVATDPTATAAPAAGPRSETDSFFDAWKASHDRLVVAVRTDQEAHTAFAGVIANLELYQASLPEASRAAVATYAEHYRGLYARTDGFRRYTQDFTRQDALAELGRTAQQVVQQTRPR